MTTDAAGKFQNMRIFYMFLRLIKMFDYGRCGCIEACSERLPKGKLIQYGNYKVRNKVKKQI
jgi:hypothetical protein